MAKDTAGRLLDMHLFVVRLFGPTLVLLLAACRAVSSHAEILSAPQVCFTPGEN